MNNPKRGEIWYVNFDPTVGAEIQKKRPAVVVSIPELYNTPLRIVVPITEFKEKYVDLYWHIKLGPTQKNGLTKTSSANTLQSKSVSLVRFTKKIGVITAEQLTLITDAIAEVIGVGIEK